MKMRMNTEELTWFLYLPLLFVLYLFTNHLLRKMRNFPPSPFLSFPIIGHLYLAKKPLFRAFAEVSHHYGPVVFLQMGTRPVLLVSSSEISEECFSKNDVIFANRPKILCGKHLGYNYTSLAWSSYGDHWRTVKKISLTEILSTHKLELLRYIRIDEGRKMVKLLNRGAKEGKPMDMKKTLFDLTMNVIMRMISGKRFYGENVEDLETARRVWDFTKDSMRLATSHTVDFLPALKWLGYGVEEEIIDLQMRRDVFLQEFVEECRREFAEHGVVSQGKAKSMIEMLMALQEKDPEYYTDTFIRSLMTVMLVAGTDTSAVTMEWAMSNLLNNPDVLKKAQAEIDKCVGHSRFFEETDVANLPYLQCIINETLRLYPAAPLLIPHESSEACTIGGYSVPAGTMLIMNVWAIQNDPKNWEDAGEFKPERFMGRLQGMGGKNKYKLMPFGVGRRACPGEGLAVRIVGYVLGTLIQCFDWGTVGNELIDMEADVGLTMFRKMPFLAICKPRAVAQDLLSRV